MHIAIVEVIKRRLLPALEWLHTALTRRSTDRVGIVKVGRTEDFDRWMRPQDMVGPSSSTEG